MIGLGTAHGAEPACLVNVSFGRGMELKSGGFLIQIKCYCTTGILRYCTIVPHARHLDVFIARV